MKTVEQIATECGAEIGTWDKSGNGQKLISFTHNELSNYTKAILRKPLAALKQAKENISHHEGKREYHRLLTLINEAISEADKGEVG